MIGFARKVGMTRLFIGDRSVAVTVLQFGKQHVLQKKTLDKDGYQAVQIGSFGKKKTNKAISGHISKQSGQKTNFMCIEEFRDVELADDKNSFDVSDFEVNDTIDLSANTIGKGFAGVVKRHGFGGQPASHGHDHKRAPGSIGSRWPQRTIPGKKMAGRMGGKRVTVKSAQIINIDPEKNLLFIKGSIPGANTAFVKIRKSSLNK